MPFKLKLKKSRQYNVSSKNLFVISVELLDNTTVECTLSAQSLGQECLANVCQRLGLHQPQYFGLRFLSKKSTYWWLDLQKPLKKQLDKYAQENSSLYLGVMYFVSDVNMLHDEVTRYHYFLQLKSDIVESKLHCNEDQTVLFASYSLQAEFGDHDPERHTTEYLKNFGLLPKHMFGKDNQDAILEKVIRTHQSLQGLSQQLAEIYYIMEAQRLGGYGQECFAGKDSSGAALFVCLSLKGIFIRYMNDQPSSTFLWDQIVNLVHHKRCFGIEGRDSPKVVQVLMEDPNVAKYVWQTCIQQHQFYTKNESVAISPKITELLLSGAAIPKVGKPIPEEQPSPPIQNKSEETSVKYQLQESQESLDGLGVYHTEGCYSELLSPTSMYKQLVLCDEKSSPMSIYQNVPLPNCSSAMTSSTPTLQTTYPPSTMCTSSSATQLHMPEVEEPPIYVPHHLLPRNDYEQEVKCSVLPSYRQAPDYDTAVKLKYGIHSCSAQELSISSPHVQSQSTVARSPLDAYALPYQTAAPLQSYAQYKNYTDLSHLDANDLPQEGTEHILSLRHYENVSAPMIHSPVHTYSSPELASQSMLRDIAPEQMISNVHMMYQFKPPPPYPYKQSTSTPDLTKSPQKILQLNASPNNSVTKDFTTIIHTNSDLNNAGYVYNAEPIQTVCFQGQEQNVNVHYPGTVHGVACEPQSITTIETVAPMSPPANSLPVHTYQNYNQNVLQISVVDSIACHVTEPAFSTVMTAQSTKMTYQAPQTATMVKPSDALSPKSASSQPVEKVSPRKPANLALNDDSHGMGPMLVATMNGLTLSQPDIVASGEDKKFPNDSRIQALETRLAEGQVFLEFEHIIKKKPMADFMTALMHENMPKNRFKDVFPYEENRVKLTPTSENKTGYINASHITVSVGGYQRFYIAAQGPLLNTLYSFWQMIWEHQVPVVVMLTEVQEEGQDKCFPYWPQEDNKSLQIGEFQITRNFSMSSPTYVTCSLTLCHITSHQQRSVWHIQYTDWPDHSCPEDVQGFITFMSEVDAVRRLAVSQLPQVRQMTSPILVHCSAGVGRSGVVVLCDIMLQALDHNQPIDVPKVLTQLRLQRMLTVQTLAQYKFVYTVLVQYLKNSRLI